MDGFQRVVTRRFDRRVVAETAVAMAFLGMVLPLRAQSLQNQPFDAQPRRIATVLQDDHFLPAPEIGPEFNGRETSTAFVEGALSANAVSTATLFRGPDIFAESCASTTACAARFAQPQLSHLSVDLRSVIQEGRDGPRENSKSSSAEIARPTKPRDFNQNLYYKNKLEFGLDVGYLPINIPFVFDFLLGDGYNMTPLKYTLVPVIASVRWQMDDIAGPWILRGNWDLTCSGAVVAIPRGPETRYFAWIMGIRRNFVPRNWKAAPYVDGRLGLGDIDAKGPLGVIWSQGQDFTFTVNLGSGVRYNFSPRYSISAGLNWMHISNLYLSQPSFANYGINVYGPMFGIDIRISKPHHKISE
jgi:hypothetical protein